MLRRECEKFPSWLKSPGFYPVSRSGFEGVNYAWPAIRSAIPASRQHSRMQGAVDLGVRVVQGVVSMIGQMTASDPFRPVATVRFKESWWQLMCAENGAGMCIEN